jgi:enoyl-CoA hydratase/carnithine racemase
MLGYHRAAEALLLGEPFMAEAALEVGLVNRVAPSECNALAQAQARKLAAKPLSALIETKRLMKAGQASEVQARMQEEGASFARLMAGPPPRRPSPPSCRNASRTSAVAEALAARCRLRVMQNL